MSNKEEQFQHEMQMSKSILADTENSKEEEKTQEEENSKEEKNSQEEENNTNLSLTSPRLTPTNAKPQPTNLQEEIRTRQHWLQAGRGLKDMTIALAINPARREKAYRKYIKRGGYLKLSRRARNILDIKVINDLSAQAAQRFNLPLANNMNFSTNPLPLDFNNMTYFTNHNAQNRGEQTADAAAGVVSDENMQTTLNDQALNDTQSNIQQDEDFTSENNTIASDEAFEEKQGTMEAPRPKFRATSNEDDEKSPEKVGKLVEHIAEDKVKEEALMKILKVSEKVGKVVAKEAVKKAVETISIALTR